MPTRHVDTPNDPSIVAFLGLRDHAHRQIRERPGGDQAGTFMAEGNVVIQRALAAGHQLEAVLVDARRTADLELPRDAQVLAASATVLEAVSGRPSLRDPIAMFTRPTLPDIGAVLEASRTVVVAEAVTNPVNMGVIARTAAALGIDALLVDPTSCDPLYRRAVRVSMGQVFAIPHVRLAGLPDGLTPLTDAGFELIALTPGDDADEMHTLTFGLDHKVALLLGAEGPGLQASTMQRAHRRVAIPMARDVDSLNVASAAAIACYAVQQARRG